MQGNAMQQEFKLSEGVKALIVAYVKDKTEENLIKAFNEFGVQNNIFAKEIKHIALDEFRAEIDRLVTRDEFQASLQALEARLEAKIAQLRTEMAEVKLELKQDIAEVRAEIAEVKIKGLYWLLGTAVVSAVTILSGVWAMMNFMLSNLK